jgi:hypothetical protein
MLLRGCICGALLLAAPAEAAPRITGLEPARPHAGAPLVVSVTSAATVCLSPVVGHPRCAQALPGADGTARVRFVAPYLGRWSVTAEAGGQRVSRGLRVLPRGKRVMVLAAGDSLVRNLGFGLRREFPRATRVHTEVSQGRGLTKADGFDWPSEARKTAERYRPDVAIVFLGGNEGFPIDLVSCCGPDWIGLFAVKQRDVMRGYQGDGATRVYWVNLPAPGPTRTGHRLTWTAENQALVAAAADDDARIFDAGALLTPGFTFRRSLEWHGRSRKVREDDGIHLTRAGGLVAAEALLAQLRADQVLR